MLNQLLAGIYTVCTHASVTLYVAHHINNIVLYSVTVCDKL